MLFKTIPFTTLLSIASVYAQQQAQVVSTNPTDVVLRADFPSGYSQNVVGVIQFYSLNGTTKVHVDVTGLPKNAGVFTYHIHDLPVGADGNCDGTGKHFNPFNASSDCDSQPSDQFCQIGDLSGKHGYINTTCFETYYYDPYLSLDPSHPQYIGNKAINIHLEDQSRLACATIKPSFEPEDLLLLNSETEEQQVQNYEELSGISARGVEINTFSVDEDGELSVDRRDSELDSETGEVGEADNAENAETETETDADADAESEDADVDAEDKEFPEIDDLDDLLNEDVEKNVDSIYDHNNGSNYTNGTNGSMFSNSTFYDEENSASLVSPESISLKTIGAVVLGGLFAIGSLF